MGPNVSLYSEISWSDLTTSLSDHPDREQVLEFILDLDLAIADYGFTVRLRDALTAAIKLEDEA